MESKSVFCVVAHVDLAAANGRERRFTEGSKIHS